MSKHLETLRRELAAVAAAAAYFLVWLGALMLLKVLILEEYQIPYHQFSLVLVGALSLSKVVLLLERVPLGGVTRPRPAWIEVAARTGLYVGGVFVVLLLEKAFEARHEAGGFAPALRGVFEHRDMPHVWANALCMTGALLSYNLLALLRHHLGPGGLRRLLASPAPSGGEGAPPPTTHA